MSKFIISYKYRKSESSTPSVGGSDLVALGILEKPISEFTDADIGTEVSIPYTDASGVISGPIVFEIVGVNHHTNSDYDKTITLMSKNIIRLAVFDAAEPDNTNSYRKNNGNNRWSVSNIRQWLNSSEAANSWRTAQHEYDTAPPYADAPGFLAGFSSEVIKHFTKITNTTSLCDADGGGSEITDDYVFLPSFTEMFRINNNGVAEGTYLSLRYTDDNSRIKRIKGGQGNVYLMRSPSLRDRPAHVLVVASNREK